jgi:heat shock protein HslJ
MLLAAAALLIVVAACAPTASPSPTPLAIEGVWWRAVSVNGVAPRTGAEPAFRLQDGRIEGTTGCNSFGGDARVVDGRLEAPELMQTLIGCEDAVAEVERLFNQALASAALSTDGTRLIVTAPAAQFVFETSDESPILLY